MLIDFATRIVAPRRVGPSMAFFAPIVAGMVQFSSVGWAQQVPDDLQQRLQQQRQDPSGAAPGFGPQSVVLQPAVPQISSYQSSSRLEQILSSRAGVKLQQFGYDQLGSGRAVIIPQTGAVQDDYVLGPGDSLIVSLRGQENGIFNITVDRNGQVMLPRIPPIAASGRSFGNFRQDLDTAIHRAYVGTEASVSIGRVRQISVLVSGEINEPGQRLLTGLSSAVDALLLSGGVRKTGSLRNIRIARGGHQYTVDLYNVLTGRGAGSLMRLADGDRIIVPPLGRTVAVTGLVRRPGIYELPGSAGGMTVQALLNVAGGQEVRGLYRLSVQRIEADGRLKLLPLHGNNEVVRDSEILRVELGADLPTSRATLSGGIGLSGQYAVAAGTRLSDVIKAPGALGTSPYTLFGIIVRKDPRTLLRSLIAFTPAAVVNGTEDQQLQNDDVVRPISVDEAQLLNFVLKTYLDKLALDQARIRNPLEANQSDAPVVQNSTSNQNGTMNTVQANTGEISPDNPFGVQPGALEAYSIGQEDFSGVPAEVQRSNIITLLDLPAPGTYLAQQRKLAYQQALLTANASVPNQTPSQAAQAQQAAMLASQTGTPLQANTVPGQSFAGGHVQPGQQQTPTNGMGVISSGAGLNEVNGVHEQADEKEQANLPQNYQEEPVAPGDYASNREVHTFGELSRQLGIDPLVLVNFLIDRRARLDGAVRGPGFYLVGPNASLNDLVQAAGGTASWADESGVEVLTTLVDARNGRAATQRQTLPLRQGTLASYVVRPRDQFHFKQVFTDTGIGLVSVQGEVRFGGNYSITRGEHLSDLLLRVGGLSSTAYPAGTVFLRKSAAKIEEQGYKRTASEIQSQLLAGMARIGNDKITGEGFTAIQGFIVQLRNQKGLGRISITADPSVLAANPQQDPLLEAGDVIFIPQRPSTVTVLGEVMQPGSYSYQPGMSVRDYIKKAGGYAQYSDEGLTFIVQPNGEAHRLETSWLNFEATTLPPGSSIVVPRDLAPLTPRQIVLDTTGIMSSLAVTIASLAILAKQ